MTTPEPENYSKLAKFLEAQPPGQRAKVFDLTTRRNGSFCVHGPDIVLHCPSEKCGGPRTFGEGASTFYLADRATQPGYLWYKCKNCNITDKVYAVVVSPDSVGDGGTILKIGEEPQFGPPTPPRLLAMLGEYRETFLKGRRCEIHGLGIGAFSYYRRIVEDQKNCLISEMLKVAEKLGANQHTRERFKAALEEKQFAKAVDDLNDVIPDRLLLEGGHNPLKLLHTALSRGIHAKSDEECLTYATHIRTLLSELADRIGFALKDNNELKSAVAKLLDVERS